VIVIEEPKVFTTPNATMTTFAAPSRGSTELTTWRVSMAEGASGPSHVVDREQVWLPLTGTLTVVADGVSTVVGPGQSVVLPAGVVRTVSTPDGPAEAVVCMPVGGAARVGDEVRRLPWAL
jgi:quercetin dioxygenase-like cupin family protein